MPDGKCGDLTSQAGSEVFHGVLSGTVHQNEAVEIERGEISSRTFEPFSACVPQVKSADDGADDDVGMCFPAGFDRVDDPGVAAARDQQAGGQKESLFLRDEIWRRA